MKRLALFLGSLVLLLQITGCGGSAPAPADGSNLPPEVKEAEDKMAADMAKRIAEQNKGKTP